MGCVYVSAQHFVCRLWPSCSDIFGASESGDGDGCLPNYCQQKTQANSGITFKVVKEFVQVIFVVLFVLCSL